MWSEHERAEEILAVVGTLAKKCDLVVEAGADSSRFPQVVRQRTGLVVLSSHTAPGIERSNAAARRPTTDSRQAVAGRKPLVLLSSPTAADLYAWAAVLPDDGVLLAVPYDTTKVPDLSNVSCASETFNGSFDGLLVRRKPKTAVRLARELTKRPRPRRPLRSVYLGHLRYPSLYGMGVTQGLAQAGAWHRCVDICDDISVIDRAVREMAPDLIFTHMLLWPPLNAPPLYELLERAAGWRAAGAVVVVHDGDPRAESRYDHDVSASVDLALCNHLFDRSSWGVTQVWWPYAAMAQSETAAPTEAYGAELAFAGTVRDGDGDLYADRSRFLALLKERLGSRMRVFGPDDGNNRMVIAEIAPACTALIGCGRPDVTGWVDTRVFTVPGAGGLLIHDHAPVLAPNVHFLPYARENVDSVLEALERAKVDAKDGGLIRRAGFAQVQRYHSYPVRVKEVLDLIYDVL